MNIAYFVHDLNDAAVIKRVMMLKAGGAEVTVLGFHRTDKIPDMVGGAPAIDLGQTRDAALGKRMLSVLSHVGTPAKLKAASASADVIIALNLESLAIALRVAGGRPVVYECLDIHAMLLGQSIPHRGVQALENRLLAHVDLLWTSSPAFEAYHFRHKSGLSAPVMLVENKILQLDAKMPEFPDPPATPPFVIGWFGMLRCARTLRELISLVMRHDGRVKVLIAGKPSPAIFPDLEAMIADVDGIEFAGAYRPDDLPGLYARCHYAWAIDWYEAGQNSSWLLPNRLYEASAYGVVPIALASVETGRWLARHDAGLLLTDGLTELDLAVEQPDDRQWQSLRGKVMAIPMSDLVTRREDCTALVESLRDLQAGKQAAA